MAGRVVSVNVGRESTGEWTGPRGRTGIDKRPVAHRIAVRRTGLTDDCVVRGDDDQAVYAYAREDVGWWEHELGRELPPGRFGENLSTMDIDVTGAAIGEQWAVGTAVLQVCGPRVPCVVFEGFWGMPGLIELFTRHAVPGAYLRVLAPGEMGSGDRIEILDRPRPQVTVGEAFRALTTEPDLLPRLAAAPALMAKARLKAERRLSAGEPR